MSVARQLYQLQEIDLQIETDAQTLGRFAGQLGESQAVIRTRNELTLEQQHLEELEKQQHSTEWEIDDLTTKVVAEEEKLYSGRITNPKELTSLQHDVDGLKARRSKLEDKALPTRSAAPGVALVLDLKLDVVRAIDLEAVGYVVELVGRGPDPREDGLIGGVGRAVLHDDLVLSELSCCRRRGRCRSRCRSGC